jgi:dynein heavy chain 1
LFLLIGVNFRIEKEYFAGITYQELDVESLRGVIIEFAENAGLIASDEWVEKTLQLYRFQQIHHGIMLVGSAGTGKTSIYQTLLKALEKVEGIESVYHQIDAKVMSKEELYGVLDPTTREWNDGLFTATLRRIVDNLRGEGQKRHWIVFDGDVDPEWVENLNSVLDDNKVLTLPNGERIALPENVRLLFEVESLKYATPATVSRCGMIWLGRSIVDSKMQLQRELHLLKNVKVEDIEDDLSALLPTGMKADEIQKGAFDLLSDLFTGTDMNRVNLEALIDKSLELDHVMEFSVSRLLCSFFSLVKAACFSLQSFVNQNPDFPPSVEQRNKYMKKKILLALVWAFSGDCSLEERKVFGEYLFSLPSFVEIAPPSDNSAIDFEVTLPEGEWVLWLDKVPTTDLDTHSIIETDVVVPTVDTARHESLIYGLLNDHKPIILCGPPGSGKTMTLFGALRKSPNLDVVGLNFSKATTPELLIKSIEQYCEYKKTVNGTVLSPTQIGRWLVVFCDEINLPAVDHYGTQRVISLLRQMVEKNGFWKEKEKLWVSLSNIQFVGACNPPSDVGRNAMNMRFMRHCAVVLVGYPGETSLKQIYGSYNKAILKCVPTLRGYSKELTEAMVELYLKSQQHFTSDVRSHYIYSPRELTRWCRGIYEYVRPLEELSIEGLVRIWAHEAIRLFHDRLVEDEERRWTHELVKDIATKYFLNAELGSALKGPILYSNWLTKDYLPVDQNELKQYVQARVKTFCEEELDTPLILYDDLLDHVLRIDRVLRQAQGHLILIGVSGSGKVSIGL